MSLRKYLKESALFIIAGLIAGLVGMLMVLYG